MRSVTSAFFALALVGVSAPAALIPAQAFAQAADPAAQQIGRFDDALLATMKAKGGFEARFARLSGPVKQTFDLPVMIHYAVGPSWTGMSASDQAALLAAFTRFSISTWAKNFDSYSGEKFVTGKVDTRGLDKLVHTQLVPTSGSPTDLVYRMRQAAGGQWKVIDVYFNGSISQLSQQRADFASTLASGGAPALVKKINALADKQAKGD